MAIRHNSREATTTALQDSLWELSYDISFEAGKDATVWIALPKETNYATIISEEFPGREDTTRRLTSGARDFVSKTRVPGPVRVTAEFKIRLSPEGNGHRIDDLVNLRPDDKSRYLQQEDGQLRLKLDRELQQITGDSETDEERLQLLFDHCTHDIKGSNQESESDSVANIIDGSRASSLGRARTMVALCRAADFPTRLVTGFELRQQTVIKPHVWLEVFRDNLWIPFDPEYGFARHMPVHFIPARIGGEVIARPSDTSVVDKLESTFSMRRLAPSREVLKSGVPHFSQALDLTNLPVGMHGTLSLLLLLPLGALITALFRNVIGIQTYGTFAPALLAMSFIYADLATGLVVFGVIIAVGLGGRSLVERLHLLMVPRLSIILTLIILCVLFGVSMLNQLGLTPTGKAILLPLVVLTIMIERFYVSAEEDGIGFALQLVVGTIVVSVFCFLLLSWNEVGRLILIYPEIHLLTIAAFIAIGRYTGYRMTELWRFRDLARGEQRPPTPPSAAMSSSVELPSEDAP
ncbi:7TM domain-containing protein [Adhaeretor mobilis]|uniref:Transglutaminase-like superfamily protein n=1 Tax=Adhaeretor mobilis TaxID=1930276 RepID=A0A517MZI6_9BACT|nr:7TM domain-containing protein [Adhaeretor mobilis]QDT00293.1 Transglutaminase-like superfamily protein [Adhaeretor mobilis]